MWAAKKRQSMQIRCLLCIQIFRWASRDWASWASKQRKPEIPGIVIEQMKASNPLQLLASLAEGKRFELLLDCSKTVFKTGALKTRCGKIV